MGHPFQCRAAENPAEVTGNTIVIIGTVRIERPNGPISNSEKNSSARSRI
jgi:hypothetical protein